MIREKNLKPAVSCYKIVRFAGKRLVLRSPRSLQPGNYKKI